VLVGIHKSPPLLDGTIHTFAFCKPIQFLVGPEISPSESHVGSLTCPINSRSQVSWFYFTTKGHCMPQSNGPEPMTLCVTDFHGSTKQVSHCSQSSKYYIWQVNLDKLRTNSYSFLLLFQVQFFLLIVTHTWENGIICLKRLKTITSIQVTIAAILFITFLQSLLRQPLAGWSSWCGTSLLRKLGLNRRWDLPSPMSKVKNVFPSNH
jgi:hypothetical protein